MNALAKSINALKQILRATTSKNPPLSICIFCERISEILIKSKFYQTSKTKRKKRKNEMKRCARFTQIAPFGFAIFGIIKLVSQIDSSGANLPAQIIDFRGSYEEYLESKGE